MALLCAASGGAGAQPTPASQARPPVPMPANSYLRATPQHLVAAGDLDGDGRDEIVSWDRGSGKLTVAREADGKRQVLTELSMRQYDYVTALAILDVDADGRGELLVGEGLAGADPADASKSEVRLSLYEPLERSGWKPTVVFHGPSTRPEVSGIQLASPGGDGKPQVLFRYFESKYFVVVAMAHPAHPAGSPEQDWRVEKIDSLRMGTEVAAGRVYGGDRAYIVIARPYAEPTAQVDPKTGQTREVVSVGDAFVLREGVRDPLPVHRGVSSLAIGHIRGGGAADIVVGDGWHFDYGKLARARVAVLRHLDGRWDYEVIEDIPDCMRVVQLSLVDLDGDGRDEIIALGEGRQAFKRRIRLYQYTGSGWRGTTLAEDHPAFAVANLDGKKGRELILAGPEPKTRSLALRQVSWDAKLAEALDTYKVEPDELIGKPAPALVAEEWLGGEPQTPQSLRGKVVLLDFWATWCVPCIKTFPALKQMLAEHQDAGFMIIGVTNHSNQTTEDVRRFLQKDPLPWPVAIDPQSRPHMAFGSGAIPHQVLIDRNGVVRAYYVGGGREAQLEQEIRKLLAEDRPGPQERQALRTRSTRTTGSHSR